MNAFSIAWNPIFPPTVFIALAAIAVAVLALGVYRRAAGIVWRTAAAAALLAALGDPVFVVEDREALTDIAVVLVDETASQRIGERADRTAEALAEIEQRLADRDDVELRVTTVSPGDGAAPGAIVDGTHLFSALNRALSDVPRQRLAGVFLITDGQVHDVPDPATVDLGAPLHVLLSGERDAGDRRLQIIQAPSFGIVGQEVSLTVRVDDPPRSGESIARLTLRRDGDTEGEVLLIPLGVDHELTLPIDRGGASVFELSVDPGPFELTEVNNRSVVVVNGVRDRLRVLLVSGSPHPGERAWRNLLKADPSVDLVHFTILRPPEKQDGTPVHELSLIAFPIRELFEIKLPDFDLIIFDNYQRRGVLPQFYLGNIADYVANGGALLEAGGPSFATPASLFRTPLSAVLPGEPTGNVISEGFIPSVTDAGRRHPVTATIAAPPDTDAEWGRWFRQVEVGSRSGAVVMEGTRDRPLLILDRVGEGRVAQLLSDHIWLWARGFEGGGPHAELMRRLSHWLMKEPDLEEDNLAAAVVGNQLNISRRSLAPDTSPVEVTSPSGDIVSVPLEEIGGGRSEGTVDVDQAGLYHLTDGERTTIAAVGTLNPREFQDVAASAEPLRPVVEATGGGTVWLADDDRLDLRRVAAGRAMAGGSGVVGSQWLGLQANGDFTVRGVSQLPLLPALLVLLATLSTLLLGWRREGR